jgi:SSS family solute:Na+ symporter
MTVRWTELAIFTLLFAVVTGLGFYAARWKAGFPLDHLDEWGLGGRRFGSWVTWFLISGDIFTAYTFVALPALMWGVGPYVLGSPVEAYRRHTEERRDCFSVVAP